MGEGLSDVEFGVSLGEVGDGDVEVGMGFVVPVLGLVFRRGDFLQKIGHRLALWAPESHVLEEIHLRTPSFPVKYLDFVVEFHFFCQWEY